MFKLRECDLFNSIVVIFFKRNLKAQVYLAFTQGGEAVKSGIHDFDWARNKISSSNQQQVFFLP